MERRLHIYLSQQHTRLHYYNQRLLSTTINYSTYKIPFKDHTPSILDLLLQKLTNELQMSADKHIPKRHWNNRRKCIWMDKFALKCVKNKHSSYLKYMNCKTNQNLRNFKHDRNKATTAIKYAVQKYENSIANDTTQKLCTHI